MSAFVRHSEEVYQTLNDLNNALPEASQVSGVYPLTADESGYAPFMLYLLSRKRNPTRNQYYAYLVTLVIVAENYNSVCAISDAFIDALPDGWYLESAEPHYIDDMDAATMEINYNLILSAYLLEKPACLSTGGKTNYED